MEDGRERGEIWREGRRKMKGEKRIKIVMAEYSTPS